MKIRRLLATIAFGLVSLKGQIKVIPHQYEVANYFSDHHSNALRVFPSKGTVVTIDLPFRIQRATFAPDGKSIYGIIVGGQGSVGRDRD